MRKQLTMVLGLAAVAVAWGVADTAAAQEGEPAPWETGAPPPAEEEGAAQDDTWEEGGGGAAEDDEWDEGGGGTATASNAPTGLWVAGGVATSAFRGPFGTGGLRAEVGLPLAEIGPGTLDLALPVSWQARGGLHIVDLVPEVQFEIEIPLDIPQRLTIAPYAGLGISLLFWDLGGPFGGNDYTGVALQLPMGAWGRFTFANGLMLQVMPLGMSFNIGLNDESDGFYMRYHFFAMAGYRWE